MRGVQERLPALIEFSRRSLSGRADIGRHWPRALEAGDRAIQRADSRAREFAGCRDDGRSPGSNNGVESWPNVRYYTLGLGSYREPATWLIPGTRVRRMSPDADGVLSSTAPKREGSDRYVVDFGVDTGPNNGWATRIGRHVLRLHDRAAMDARMLTFTTEPLATDWHTAGSPTIDMNVSSRHTDGAVLLYLEEVDPTGRSRYNDSSHGAGTSCSRAPRRSGATALIVAGAR